MKRDALRRQDEEVNRFTCHEKNRERMFPKRNPFPPFSCLAPDNENQSLRIVIILIMCYDLKTRESGRPFYLS